MNLLSVMLDGSTQGNPMMQFGMIILIIVIFYFFMIRPQQKKQKDLQKSRAAMKTGDKVVTAGGIHGKIKEVNETDFIIEIADNVRIKVEKSSVFATSNDAAR